MGGLIARYYLRYGEYDTLDDNDFKLNLHGAERVRRVILLGTPNLGSVSALHAFIKGCKIGGRQIPTETLATMPSTYQLFPHALNDWLITANGKPLHRDLYDVEIWRRFQWSIFDPRVRVRIMGQYENQADGTAYLELLDPSIQRHKWVSFPLDYPIFLCESHYNLTGNVTFQDSLLHTLLSLDSDY
jgi:hypothetical protein